MAVQCDVEQKKNVALVTSEKEAKQEKAALALELDEERKERTKCKADLGAMADENRRLKDQLDKSSDADETLKAKITDLEAQVLKESERRAADVERLSSELQLKRDKIADLESYMAEVSGFVQKMNNFSPPTRRPNDIQTGT